MIVILKKYWRSIMFSQNLPWHSIGFVMTMTLLLWKLENILGWFSSIEKEDSQEYLPNLIGIQAVVFKKYTLKNYLNEWISHSMHIFKEFRSRSKSIFEWDILFSKNDSWNTAFTNTVVGAFFRKELISLSSPIAFFSCINLSLLE